MFDPRWALVAVPMAIVAVAACTDKSDDDDDDDEEDGDGGSSQGSGCADLNLGSDLGEPVATGNSNGSGNDQAYCGEAPGGSDSGDSSDGRGPDVTFKWTAPDSGTYTFSTAGTDFDTMLTLRLGSCTSSPEQCDDDGGSDLDSEITVSLDNGQEVYLTLDGYGSDDAGAYVLNIVEGSGGGHDNDSGW